MTIPILILSILNAALIVALVWALLLIKKITKHQPLHWFFLQSLGPLGIRGWFLGQWRRLTGFRPDYRMSPEPRSRKDIPLTEMYGAVCGKGDDGVEWNPPAFSQAGVRQARTFSREQVAEALGHLSDYSMMSDEDLADQAKLGNGMLGEIGYRDWKKSNIRPADTAGKMGVCCECQSALDYPDLHGLAAQLCYECAAKFVANKSKASSDNIRPADTDFVSDEGKGTGTPPPLEDNIRPADTP